MVVSQTFTGGTAAAAAAGMDGARNARQSAISADGRIWLRGMSVVLSRDYWTLFSSVPHPLELSEQPAAGTRFTLRYAAYFPHFAVKRKWFRKLPHPLTNSVDLPPPEPEKGACQTDHDPGNSESARLRCDLRTDVGLRREHGRRGCPIQVDT